MSAVNQFNAVRISLASPEQIRSCSRGEVTKPETINYRTLKPERDGLFCERIFGPTKDWECSCGKYKGVRYKGIICDKCGVEVTHANVRRERMGHIELASPVSHIWFVRGTPSRIGLLLDVAPRVLDEVMYLAKYIITEVDEVARQRAIEQALADRDEQIARAEGADREQCQAGPGSVSGTSQHAAPTGHASSLAPEARPGIDQLGAEIDTRIARIRGIRPLQTLTDGELESLLAACGHIFKAGIGAEAIRECLQRLNLDELAHALRRELQSSSGPRRARAARRLRLVEAFRKSGTRPEWMIMTVVPVLPPALRPIVQLDGGRFAISDVNDLYRRVINRNNRLERLQQLGAPDVILRNEKRLLQEAVDALLGNSRRGRAGVRPREHAPRSLADRLEGKQGRFRQNLLGKRVDYSGRAVIVVGPDLKLHQCGLPKQMALELFKPFLVRKLLEQQRVLSPRAAKRMAERVDPEVWHVLAEVIRGHPVLLNRAPTLHRLSIQAFEPVLVEGSAIQLHPLVCAAFNADFDGDQMTVHVPLSAAARREAYELMLSTRNLLQPSNGEPSAAPTLDVVLGCYYLTQIRPGLRGEGGAFADGAEARLAHELGQIHLQASIRVRVPDSEAVAGNRHSPGSDANRPGRLTSTSVGRIIFNEAINGALRQAGVEELPFTNDQMDKSSLKRLVAQLIRHHDNHVTACVLDAIKHLGFAYATRSGITIAVGDLKTPARKQAILAEADAEAARIERDYRRGLITDQERYEEVVALWLAAKEQMVTAVGESLDPFGSVHMMAISGAKGNLQQITQMAGMRGLMAGPTGRIIEEPIRSSFREGLSVQEYFLSTHGARKGLADTALRTGEAGYLTRRLVDVAQHVIIREEDCGTSRGIQIGDLGDPARRQTRLGQLVGRVAAQPVVHPETGVLVLDANEEIDEARRDQLAASGIAAISVRSPLQCESRHGLCRLCYGWHLGTRRLARVGDAVGIVAAQSIGEPATQLVLRVFHGGGVAARDIVQGLPRVEELFEARVPRDKAGLSEIDGAVELVQQEGRRLLRVVSQETYRDEHELPPGAVSWVRPGEEVDLGQPLAVLDDKPVVAALAGRVEVVDRVVAVVGQEQEVREYPLAPTATLRPGIGAGVRVAAGEQLTTGAGDPHEILRIQGREAVQRYLVDEVQKEYRSQGVNIDDKHVEIVVAQMFRHLRVDMSGDTDLLPGELVDRFAYADKNRQVLAAGGEPATARPVLLGITEAALNTDSFLAAASFQRTTTVLTEAALSAKTDRLLGLKETVIVGKLVPAGSGLEARLERQVLPEAQARSA